MTEASNVTVLAGADRPAYPTGQKRTVVARDIVDSIMYIMWQLPKYPRACRQLGEPSTTTCAVELTTGQSTEFIMQECRKRAGCEASRLDHRQPKRKGRRRAAFAKRWTVERTIASLNRWRRRASLGVPEP
jgi:hypothetical protein